MAALDSHRSVIMHTTHAKSSSVRTNHAAALFHHRLLGGFRCVLDRGGSLEETYRGTPDVGEPRLVFAAARLGFRAAAGRDSGRPAHETHPVAEIGRAH